jgi:hypothetical protein
MQRGITELPRRRIIDRLRDASLITLTWLTLILLGAWTMSLFVGHLVISHLEGSNSYCRLEIRSGAGYLNLIVQRVAWTDHALRKQFPSGGPRLVFRVDDATRRDLKRSRAFALSGDANRDPLTAVANLELTIPYWFLVVLACVGPAIRLRSFLMHKRRQSRAATGHCPFCNYDVRANPARCAECGNSLDMWGIVLSKDQKSKGDTYEQAVVKS